MLSLYLHIPFCRHKCTYCSFFVLPEDDEEIDEKKLTQMKDDYLNELIQEITDRKAHFPTQELKTVYIGGGTPFQLGSERLFVLIEHILATRGDDLLEELTIELNPDPFDEVIAFVDAMNNTYEQLLRVRYSFGIQTFDDELLQQTKRNYVFNNLPGFFRELQEVKAINSSYNFDFIAFGRFNEHKNGDRELRTQHKRDFFKRLAESNLADGFSIYTLELLPGSVRYYDKRQHILPTGSDEEILDEFHRLREQIEQAGYQRYEISNFARAGQASLHNMVYWTRGSYLGLGINASSFLTRATRATASPPTRPDEKLIANQFTDESVTGVRFQNAPARKPYRSDQKLFEKTIEQLDEQESRYEELLLGLRLAQGIQDITRFKSVLVDKWETKLQQLREEALITGEHPAVRLTPAGMNVYNGIIKLLTR